MNQLLWVIALTVACGLASSEALADKRVALVIGNSAYQHTPKLENPKNDAADMAAVLETLGFRVVEGRDLDKAAMERKLRDFATGLSGADVGLFFYAGHGLQVGGQNYLVPIDAQLVTAAALDFEMVRLDLVQRTMEREAKTNILFLDACRDNPLARNLARAMGTRSMEVGRGLAAAESGVGTLISFSTQPGNVALDGMRRNSPFAGALVKHISTSSDDLSALLIGVRNDVMTETQRKQVPWEHSALTGRFYFKAATGASSPPPTSTTALSEAAQTWAAVKDTTNPAILEAYIKQFGDTVYGAMARARLQELSAAAPKREAVVGNPAATAPGPSRIKVTSATLGMNCGAPRGNVTAKVAGICNGQEVCRLPGSKVNDPDPAYGCAKAFAAEWQCSGRSGTKTGLVPAVANETNMLTLSCK